MDIDDENKIIKVHGGVMNNGVVKYGGCYSDKNYITWYFQDSQYITTFIIDGPVQFVPNATFDSLFSNLESVKEFTGLNNLNTSNVINTKWLFGSCDNLTTLDINMWDLSNVTEPEENYMFDNCRNLKTIVMPYKLNQLSSTHFKTYMVDSININTFINVANNEFVNIDTNVQANTVYTKDSKLMPKLNELTYIISNICNPNHNNTNSNTESERPERPPKDTNITYAD